MKKTFTKLILLGSLASTASCFAACPFTTLSAIPGHWVGENSNGSAAGDVVFHIENTDPNAFQGIASVTTGKCQYGNCELLPYIVGNDIQFSGTCNEKEELESVTFSNAPVSWVQGKSFGGMLPYGISFEATMIY